MGRKYHYPKNMRRSGGSVLGMIFGALLSRRGHGHYHRKPSLKRSLVRYVLERLAPRFG
jgi:hypothetical protein